MATLATAIYSSHSYSPTTTMLEEYNRTQQQPAANDQQFITTFFCRALYDYQTDDTSSLSFRKNDIIEVLTRLESGWWDGLLGDERGWFPSNYVTVISDDEAESALTGSEHSLMHNGQTSNESLQMAMAEHNEREWMTYEMTPSSLRNGLHNAAVVATADGTQSSDFWMPEVTTDGQIFYVNTQTGQRSRDLPQEAENSDVDLLVSQASSRSGTAALGLGITTPEGVGRSRGAHNKVGFGPFKRSGTPEPWLRTLADDGMSYYYRNKIDGQTRWTAPEPDSNAPRNAGFRGNTVTSGYSANRDTIMGPRLRTDSSPSGPRARSQSASDRRSYSDDSDIDPAGRSTDFSNSQASLNGHPGINKKYTSTQQHANGHFAVKLTLAERLAQSLQHALAPPPPELVAELSDTVRRAIAALVDNIQTVHFPRRPEENRAMNDLVDAAVLAVRNLLYVAAAPSSHIPNNVLPRGSRDAGTHNNASQALLKPAQRKVTATLSKVVLSARAMQFDSGSASSDTPVRIEGDAEELERAVVAFVLEVQRSQNQRLVEELGRTGLKRLHGVFGTANVGLGLLGAGAAANWKGFGWVALDENDDSSGKILGTEVIAELAIQLSLVEETFNSLRKALRSSVDESGEQVCSDGQNVITQLSSLLVFVVTIHVARHVDIDGFNPEKEQPASNELYAQSVDKARVLVRTLEVAVQSLYDDSATLFMVTQSVRHLELGQSRKDRETSYERLELLLNSLKANLRVVQQTLEALLSIGHDQADMGPSDYNGSIEWRMSRMSVIDNQFGGVLQPISNISTITGNAHDPEGEDLVDMDYAFHKPGAKTQDSVDSQDLYRDASLSEQSQGITSGDEGTSNWTEKPAENSPTTMGAADSEADMDPDMTIVDDGRVSPLFDDDELLSGETPRRPSRARKLEKVLGAGVPRHYINTVEADAKPWYLRPNYDPNEILIEPDGGVKGGTMKALVDRLTAHEHGDPAFNKTFLMTYKSFTTTEELFNLLVQRFGIQPPPGLQPREHEEWAKLKQHVIQMRVINTFKSMIVDDDVLEKDDMYILNRMKDFTSNEEVLRLPAAKQLNILIERSQRGGDAMIKMVVKTSQGPPPAPIIPKNSKKIKLLDIDPLELARQITIIESRLYQKIKPMECLQRSREQKEGDHNDSITSVIQMANHMAHWIADCILEREDSRRRANVIKQFISVADKCRALHNYSTMAAIVAGLNTPPIRRLKRTWEQVNAKFMSQLGACELTLDSNKNFTNYRSTLAKVSPPCVPFIGVFLTTLQFTQDGAKDNLPGNLINFRKRQKSAEVIQDIKRWQSPPYNFHPIPSILAYIDESLKQYHDQPDIADFFWNLSLEREPREREDEKMARLLQESGFL